MKLGIGYSTRNEVELTEQTLIRLQESAGSAHWDVHWIDGSTNVDAINFLDINGSKVAAVYRNIIGGADSAIAYKLTLLLNHPKKYTHIGLLESDVLLDDDWFEPTMDLFGQGKQNGLSVGAVSARSFVDRVLIQRNNWAVVHNLGAGFVIFTREAAEIVLQSFRTAWWQDNVRLFGRLAGIDLRTYAAFRGNEQWVTTDWQFEAQLARHGLAALALTPARCQMIGQKWPLAQQGLELTTQSGIGFVLEGSQENAFECYQFKLAMIRQGKYEAPGLGVIHREGQGMLFFPHQIGHLAGAAWQGTLELKWNQGFGPFAYRAGKGGASLSVPVSGICSFLVTGGPAGANVTIQDTRSGFKFAPDLPAGIEAPVSISVPGTPVLRMVTLDLAEGAVFYGFQCNDPQLLDNTFSFTWSQLPEAI